jgi:plasmid stability protein
MTVHLPDELRERLAAEAARQGKNVDALVAEFVAAQLPAETAEDPLEAFIGSGSSGRGDLARRHREIRAEMTDGLAARDL